MGKEEQTKIGQHFLYLAQDLTEEKGKRSQTLSEHHFLYRWWFPTNSPIVAFIQNYFGENYVKNELKHITIGKEGYYALYLGKTTNGRNRFRQHTEGPIKNSTLRETIRAILTIENGETCDEEQISDILRPCYYEWMEFVNDIELMDCFEMMAIAIGNYPLNIEGNHSVSKEWKDMIINQRHLLKPNPE